jgi:enoyl-CoA hydratase/carnithine racemase
VVTLTLNRPMQYNSLSRALMTDVQKALDDIAQDETARVLVIAGAGRAFCAGHDLKEMRTDLSREFQRQLFDQCSRIMLSLTRLPQPVIARVHGIATAAGCQLVSMCDLAVASTEARFAVSGVKYGLFCTTPAVGLARNLGRKQAMEMLLTGDFIDAETALARGLVNRVVPPERLDGEIETLAASIVAKSPVAVRLGKQAFYRQIEMGLAEAYEHASEVMTLNTQTADAQEGIDAFLQKREPTWRGR